MSDGPTRALRGTAALLVAAMAASFAPTPLYPRYQERWDLASAQVSLAFAAYAFGVVVVLLALGGLSDRVGRIPALRASGVLLLLALAVLAAAPSYEVLVAGRLLQGIATGIATSAGGAAMAELHPGGRHAGSLRYTLALSIGIAVGPLVAGLAASRLPAPYVVPYLLVGAALAPSVVVLLATTVTEQRTGGPRRSGAVAVPRALWAPFGAAAAAVAGTNLCFGVMGTFGPQVAGAVGWTSSAAAGAVVSLVLVVALGVQVAGRGLPVRAALVGCGVVGVAGWATLLAGVRAGSAAPVLAGCVLLGAGAGTGLLASAAHVALLAPPDRRGSMQSAYLLVAFTGLATVSLALGPVVSATSLATAVAVALFAAVALAATAALLVARTRATSPRSAHG